MLSAGGGHAHIGAVNTIVRGATTDVEAHGFDTATVAVDLDHSNYANVKTEGGATVTAAGGGTNQSAAPLLTNPVANDFTQTAASPTIDEYAAANLPPCPQPTSSSSGSAPPNTRKSSLPTTTILKAKVKKLTARSAPTGLTRRRRSESSGFRPGTESAPSSARGTPPARR